MDILQITCQEKKELAAWGACPPMPQAVRLLDGTLVTVRLIRPDDAPCLQAFFAQLSPASVYRRFLQHRKALPYQQALRLATVDYQKRVALVATCGEKDDIIAVARYTAPRSGVPDWAEAAIVVQDRYQGRGLGTLLLKWLAAYARAHGIRTFRGTAHPTNTQILRFVEYSRLPVEKKFESGVWNITVELEPGFALSPA
jgi:GNAT superfamily N-acetyltransferase